MPHNPSETHCTKCDVQLVHITQEPYAVCPICEDDSDALPQDDYNYDPDGDGWPGV